MARKKNSKYKYPDRDQRLKMVIERNKKRKRKYEEKEIIKKYRTEMEEKTICSGGGGHPNTNGHSTGMAKGVTNELDESSSASPSSSSSSSSDSSKTATYDENYL
jgi:hypothetical protein